MEVEDKKDNLIQDELIKTSNVTSDSDKAPEADSYSDENEIGNADDLDLSFLDEK